MATGTADGSPTMFLPLSFLLFVSAVGAAAASAGGDRRGAAARPFVGAGTVALAGAGMVGATLGLGATGTASMALLVGASAWAWRAVLIDWRPLAVVAWASAVDVAVVGLGWAALDATGASHDVGSAVMGWAAWLTVLLAAVVVLERVWDVLEQRAGPSHRIPLGWARRGTVLGAVAGPPAARWHRRLSGTAGAAALAWSCAALGVAAIAHGTPLGIVAGVLVVLRVGDQAAASLDPLLTGRAAGVAGAGSTIAAPGPRRIVELPVAGLVLTVFVLVAVTSLAVESLVVDTGDHIRSAAAAHESEPASVADGRTEPDAAETGSPSKGSSRADAPTLAAAGVATLASSPIGDTRATPALSSGDSVGGVVDATSPPGAAGASGRVGDRRADVRSPGAGAPGAGPVGSVPTADRPGGTANPSRRPSADPGSAGRENRPGRPGRERAAASRPARADRPERRGPAAAVPRQASRQNARAAAPAARVATPAPPPRRRASPAEVERSSAPKRRDDGPGRSRGGRSGPSKPGRGRR